MTHGIANSDQVEALISSPELKLIYETAPIGLAFLSTDCRYVLINQHLTEICGISIADHIGRTVRETVPQVAEQVEQIVRAIVNSGEPITGVEVNGQRPDGSNTSRVWITYWHPFKNRNGDVVGINVAAEEITERKRAEAELAASEERLRNLNETLAERVEAQAKERDRIWMLSQDLLVVSDMQGTILNVNPAWSAILGWSPADLIGKTAERLIHPEDRERTQAQLAGLATGRGSPHFEHRMLSKDGSYHWLSWRGVPDRGFIYAVARDISNIKRTQQQLHVLQRQLAHVSRQTTLGAMTASIAHEIKQPLAVIVMSANAGLRWLKRPDPDLKEIQAALEQVVRDGHRINDVIGSVRAMFGNANSEASAVDLRIIVGEILALAQVELETHKILLRNDLSDELPDVMIERVQLQQVLLNLVMNSIEAMSSVTGRERQLTITSSLDEREKVKIAVEDTGSGIDPAHMDRIFDAFFTTKASGMGLGLSICRSIVEAHGGELTASPRAPFGSTFHLSLPIAGPARTAIDRAN
jgi:PAS domain S-box-containing protein